MFIIVEQARAHNLPGTEHNRRHAITHAFCGSLRPCPMGEKALDVAYCESGPNLWPYARNGNHLGLFQVDSLWRSEIAGWSWSPVGAGPCHAYRDLASCRLGAVGLCLTAAPTRWSWRSAAA